MVDAYGQPELPALEPGAVVRIEITQPTFREYPRIPFLARDRSAFPGYKVPFILETDDDQFVVHVTSETEDSVEGDPVAGKYICNPLRDGLARGTLAGWYRRHPELQVGDTLIFEVLEPHGQWQRYRLDIG